MFYFDNKNFSLVTVPHYFYSITINFVFNDTTQELFFWILSSFLIIFVTNELYQVMFVNIALLISNSDDLIS